MNADDWLATVILRFACSYYVMAKELPNSRNAALVEKLRSKVGEALRDKIFGMKVNPSAVVGYISALPKGVGKG